MQPAISLCNRKTPQSAWCFSQQVFQSHKTPGHVEGMQRLTVVLSFEFTYAGLKMSHSVATGKWVFDRPATCLVPEKRKQSLKRAHNVVYLTFTVFFPRMNVHSAWQSARIFYSDTSPSTLLIVISLPQLEKKRKRVWHFSTLNNFVSSPTSEQPN